MIDEDTQQIRPVKRRRRSRSRGCAPAVILLLMVVCAVLGGTVVYGVLRLPAEAERVFGPPAQHLDFSRRTFYSAVLLIDRNKLTKPLDPAGVPQEFDVMSGESTSTIVDRLWRENLITDPVAFSYYLSYSGLDMSIQAGEYELSPAMTGLEIAHQLQDATPEDVDFQVIPGWRLEEIAGALPTSGLSFSPAEFLEAARRVPQGFSFSDQIAEGNGVEGFLLPGMYEVPREAEVEEFLHVLLEAFDAAVTRDLRESFRRQGLSLYEAVTLASIVERESISVDEMPMIASVFYNRLEAGMKLDSDPTVQYALGFDEENGVWWTNPLSLDDLQVNSPYNTYLYPGLPPGPIANPSSAALRAVALPAETPYYYFRAACDGSGMHVYAETFEQHLNNACE